MREEGVALGKKSDPALLHRKVEAALGVEERRAVERDPAAARAGGAEDHHERLGLPGAVGSEQHQRRGSGAERDIDRQRAGHSLQRNLEQAHRRAPARMATSSAKATATSRIERLCAVRRSESSAV